MWALKYIYGYCPKKKKKKKKKKTRPTPMF